MYQPTLFEGAIKEGSITLSDSMFNYRYLLMNLNSSTSADPFGAAIFPIFQTPPVQQAVLFVNTSEIQYHTTYMGKIIYSRENPTTLQISVPVSNVNHISQEGHNGATQYYFREIYGVR